MIIQRNGGTLQVVQKQYLSLVYGVVIGVVGVAAMLIGVFSREMSLVAVGGLFILGAIVITKGAEIITTTFEPEGGLTILYRRVFGGRQWVRNLNRTDVLGVDYVKGFDQSSVFFNHGRWCSIYLNVSFGEQILIANRYHSTWSVNKLGIPVARNSQPLDQEAMDIGEFLGVHVNTISHLTTNEVIKNLYLPQDKMSSVLQRPTQEQLDNEYSKRA